jgi:hypothetical protein
VAALAETRLTATLTPGLERTRRVRRPGVLSSAAVPDAAARARQLKELDRLAWLMDRVIPLPIIGGVGIDALLGLFPVAGDIASLMISSTIIFRAAKMGAPPELLARLIAIQCIDLAIGAVPVLGDLADAGYKANQKSVELLKEWLAQPRP